MYSAVDVDESLFYGLPINNCLVLFLCSSTKQVLLLNLPINVYRLSHDFPVLFDPAARGVSQFFLRIHFCNTACMVK
jgi:hypothetical protein